ncbi:MAG: DNA-binding protein WhiA [Oscillospiraceae bacterium]|jgi:DNA-binding protein WhiA|nr:DNA-binding protein WhiA [Oscillospiraceae bacterium]
MSFSSSVKQELAAKVPKQSCCAVAQAYGLLEFGYSFSASFISLKTENKAVAAVYRSFTITVCGLEPRSITESASASGIITIKIPSKPDRIRVIERFGHASTDISIRINRANFECDDCAAAYLRGAFLSSGAVTDPNVDYHLELSTSFHRLSLDMITLMGELGFKVRLVRRKGNNIIYLKESEQIEDCLTLMGANNSTLELMRVKMIKDIRNKANRITNCESANIDKTAAASAEQIAAIRRIESRQGLNSLPDELKELALLRLENPDMSLRELGENLNKPLSRSGVSHRMRRLIELAQK